VLAHAVREVRTLRPDIPEAKAIDALQSIDTIWEEIFPAEQARIIQTVIKQITARKDGVSIEWLVDGMTGLLRTTVDQQPARRAA
jgi:hypothetical protein